MISFFNKHKRVIFTVTVVMFLMGVFVGLGAYVFTSGTADAVAEIGGKKISYQRFLLLVDRSLAGARNAGLEISDAMMREAKQDVFREMIIEELLSRQAEKLGMRVSDFEVAVDVQNNPQFMDGKSFSPRAYYTAIYNQYHMSPTEYEDWRKQGRLAAKYKQFLFSNIKVTQEELKDYYLTRNKDLKNFEKDKDKYQDDLTREKFAQIANYLLKQLTVQLEIKDYLKQREQGK